MTSKASVPRCDFCGQLEWTLNIHKHDCPHRTDDWCQAHPVGCPEIRSVFVSVQDWLDANPDRLKEAL